MEDDGDRVSTEEEKARKPPSPSGFWGRGKSGRDYADPSAREQSREDYGATDHGGEEESRPSDAGERNPDQAHGSEPGGSERKPAAR